MSAQRILASGAAALLVLIVLAIVFHSDDSGNKPTTTLPPVTAAGVLRAHVAAGQLTLDGPVKDADELKAIDSAANARFGKDNVLDRLQVKPGADSAAWLATAIPCAAAQGRGVRADRRDPGEDGPHGAWQGAHGGSGQCARQGGPGCGRP